MNKGEKSSQDLQAIIRVPTLLTARSSKEFSARVPRVLQGAGSWAGGSDSGQAGSGLQSQQSGRVQGVRRLVPTATASAVSLGAGLGG